MGDLVSLPKRQPAVMTARIALASHLATIAEAQQRLAPYAEVERRLAQARQREEDAKIALENVNRRERQSWDDWLANPGSPQPMPLHASREIAAQQAADARDDRLAAERAVEAIASKFVELNAEIAALHAQTNQLRAAILIEDFWPELLADYERIERERATFLAKAGTIRQAAIRLGATGLAEDIALLVKGQRRVLLDSAPNATPSPPAEIDFSRLPADQRALAQHAHDLAKGAAELDEVERDRAARDLAGIVSSRREAKAKGLDPDKVAPLPPGAYNPDGTPRTSGAAPGSVHLLSVVPVERSPTTDAVVKATKRDYELLLMRIAHDPFSTMSDVEADMEI